jgi:PhnB protein
MPQLDAYLMFNGTCADAMRFYERTLSGKLKVMTNAESPVADQFPAGSGDRILHSRLTFDGGILMAADWQANQTYPGMHGFALSLTYPSIAEAQRVFDVLAEGGKVTMPFGKTFWSDGFGMLEDKFGTPWMVSTEGEES